MSKELGSLTGLRIFAAAWVMLYHFRDITPTETWHYPGVDALIRQGAFGVDLFFVLSGFILSHVYAQTFMQRVSWAGFRSFVVFRFARLYPVHLVTFLAMVALYLADRVFGGGGGEAERYTPWVALRTLTMTHAWPPTVTPPNLPAWSISAEWFAYLLFPALCLLIARVRRPVAAFGIAGMAIAVFYQEVYAADVIRVLAGFLLGMAVYQLALRTTWTGQAPWLGSVLAVGIAVWAVLSDIPRLEVGMILFAALILILSAERDWLCRVLSLRAVVYLGELSYAVYMVHWVARVVVRISAERLGVLDDLPRALIVLAYVVVTAVGSVLLLHLVERPGRRLLRRLGADTPRLARADAGTRSTTP